jgi:hypothetical protein
MHESLPTISEQQKTLEETAIALHQAISAESAVLAEISRKLESTQAPSDVEEQLDQDLRPKLLEAQRRVRVAVAAWEEAVARSPSRR